MPFKTINLGKRHVGQSVAQILAVELGFSSPQVGRHLKNRWVRLDGELCLKPGQRVRAGQRLRVFLPRKKTASDGRAAKPSNLPPIANAIAVVYCDEQIVVINKPAGLTTVRHADESRELGSRAQRFLPATLVDLLPRLRSEFAKGRIRAVHRLDKETSGLIVLARTAEAESALGKQFRAHAVERTYLALVRGVAKEECIESLLIADRGDGRRGSAAVGEPGASATGGQRAVTHVRVVERLGDFTLVECQLETGRTHQVRIHLGERGTPLCGERIYDRPLHGKPLPDASGAKRPQLHAATLALMHPMTGKRLSWRCEMPQDMRAVIARLRKQSLP